MSNKLNGLSPNAHKILTHLLEGESERLGELHYHAHRGGIELPSDIQEDLTDVNYLLSQLNAMKL